MLTTALWLLSLKAVGQISAQTFQGFTEPLKTIDVSSPESGQIESLSIELGEPVREGQILGNLDSKVLQATRRLAQSKARSTARIDSARIELQIKQDRCDKLQQLVSTGAGNREEQ